MTGSGNKVTSEYIEIFKLRRLRRRKSVLFIRHERSFKVKISQMG